MAKKIKKKIRYYGFINYEFTARAPV